VETNLEKSAGLGSNNKKIGMKACVLLLLSCSFFNLS
jgi:hypothetical protein